MSRSRFALIGLAAAALIAAVLCWQLLAPGGEGAGDAARLDGQGNADSAALPDAASSLAGGAPDALAGSGEDAAAAAAAEAAARAENYPRRRITGAVVMADGSAPPRDLVLSAAQSRQGPRVSSFRDTMDQMGGEDDSDDPVEAAQFLYGAEPAGEAPGSDAAAPASVSVTAPASTPDAAHAHAEPPARLPDRQRLAELTRTRVQPDGRFTMENVPQRRVWLVVEDDEFYADPPVRIASSAESVTVRLVRGGVLHGRVADEEGHPQADADVHGSSQFDPWMAMDSTARMTKLEELKTGADGSYRMVQVPADMPLTLGAWPSKSTSGLQGDRRKLTALQPGEQRQVDFVLRRAGRVAGIVRTLDEQPLANAHLELRRLDLSIGDMSAMMDNTRSSREVTDAEGRFAFESVPDGKFQIVLDEPGYRDAKSVKLDVSSGRIVVDVVIVADPGLSVMGQVVGPDAAPVANARVSGRRPRSLTNMYANMGDGHRMTDTADAEGHFKLTGLDAGKVTLEVEAEGFIQADLDVQAGATDVSIALQHSCSLSGIVVSTADGEPVHEFRAALKPAGGIFDPSDPLGIEKRMTSMRNSQAFKAREDGTFTLDGLEPGRYDLTVHAEGFGDTTIEDLELGADGRRGQVVMLPPEALVTGQVVSKRTGLPIEGADVSPAKGSAIEQMFEGMMGKGPRATTDDEGHFTMRGLDARPVSLHVRHADYREHTAEPLVLTPGETRDLGPIALSDGGRVHGRVLDRDGRGVPSVVVLLTNSTGSTVKRDSTDPEGRFAIGGLPPGTFNVMRVDFTMEMSEDAGPMDFLKDLVMQSVTIGEDEDREVDLRVGAGGGTRVHGTVRGTAGPAEGAMVSLMPERGGLDKLGMAMTDKSGDYEIASVKPGDYTLQVVMLDASMNAGSQPSSPLIETLTVGGSPELRHDVTLPGGVLNGRAESAVDGSAVAGVRLILQRTDEGRANQGVYSRLDGRVGETYSDAEGAFQFRYLPDGTYTVHAGGRNVVGMGQSGWARTKVEGVRVTGDGAGFKVKVKLRPGGSIAGRVSSVAGQPIEAASVWVGTEQDGWISTFSETTSDATGRYEVPDLGPGAFSLAFRADGYGYTVVPGVLVREGEPTAQDVTLPAGVALKLETGDRSPWSLSVSLIGPDGPLPTSLTALSDLAAAMGGDPQLLVGSFAPGSYQLRVTAEGQTILDTEVVLAANEATHVVTL